MWQYFYMSNPGQSGPSPELADINPLSFPLGYFDAQVQFAHKWSEITGENFAEALATKTALPRRMGGADEFTTTLQGMADMTDPSAVTASLYDIYSHRPDSAYKEREEETAFGYDFHPDTKTVKIHFNNPKRGERPLSDENMPKRRADMRELLARVKREHPEAAMLMSATWLRSTKHYRELSPPDINEQENLMSPDMKLGGNSVWGQFIDASGHTNQRVYDQFMAALRKATTLDELMSAFPFPTLKAVDPIDKYYDYYEIAKD